MPLLFILSLLAPFTMAFQPSAGTKGIYSRSNLAMAEKSRQPWEFGRFLKTASFYGALKPKLPIVSDIVREIKKRGAKQTSFSPRDLLWSSGANPTDDVIWGPLDDVVMGGASRSDLNPGDAFTGQWSGMVTTANNGGFVGIRTKPFTIPFDVSACTGLVVRVKGDGNRYKTIIRDDDDWNGIAWSTSFDTRKNGGFVDVKMPLDKFIPTRFAKTVPLKKFNKKNLTGLQLSLSKFEYDGALNPSFTEGPFELNVESISFY